MWTAASNADNLLMQKQGLTGGFGEIYESAQEKAILTNEVLVFESIYNGHAEEGRRLAMESEEEFIAWRDELDKELLATKTEDQIYAKYFRDHASPEEIMEVSVADQVQYALDYDKTVRTLESSIAQLEEDLRFYQAEYMKQKLG